MENTVRGECVKRLIQHEAKPSAVFASRHLPNAVFFVHTNIGGALSAYIALPRHLARSNFL